MNLPHTSHPSFGRRLGTFFLLGILVFLFVQIMLLKQQVTALHDELALTILTLASSTDVLSQKFTDLSAENTGISNTLSSAQQNIDAVRSQVGGVEQAVGSISGTVGTLQKLAQIDPVLLKKYSKVFFLNENYVPAHLTVLPSDYAYSTLRSEQFVSEAWPYLKNMIDGAKSNGVDLYVKSGYRSFAEQKSIKSKYSVVYGAGTANAFSAEQGYSEHQLGTTIDLTTTGLNGRLDGFDGKAAYQWMLTNGYRYGFILSYPKGNTYYVYEPWHWRFVGVKLATYLHDSNTKFYDLDQRTIDGYLVNLFD